MSMGFQGLETRSVLWRAALWSWASVAIQPPSVPGSSVSLSHVPANSNLTGLPF